MIKGPAQLVEAARKAPSSDKTVNVNWDLIDQLPEEWEAVASEVAFDFKKDFSDVGSGNFMPTPELMYRIAEARGIRGVVSEHEPIIEEVNISDMYMSDVPAIQRMIVGYRCTKQSEVIEEDGTTRRSSMCTIDYNAFNRCAELWTKEEVYTEGYTKPGKYPPKYDTRWKRKAHFYAELKFAQQKTETKAHTKTIRELAGMMTGYRQEDLKSGRFVFVKIRRSADVLKLEQAARIDAIRNGTNDGRQAGAALFGAQQIEAPAVEAEPVPPPEPEPEPIFEDHAPAPEPAAAPISAEQKLVTVLGIYQTKNPVITPEVAEGVSRVIAYYSEHGGTREGDPERWKKAMAVLKMVESALDSSCVIAHNLS